jgi:hypothetical protein
MLKLLNDGYIRMPLPAFYALQFHQHMCLQDSDLLGDFWREGIPAVNAGYYELVCDDIQPIVSVGCAWYVAVGPHDVKVGKDDVSSNVMLLDANGEDYGTQYSRAVVQNWLCSGARRRDLESAIIKETGACRQN